jgi:hypothetical protein
MKSNNWRRNPSRREQCPQIQHGYNRTLANPAFSDVEPRSSQECPGRVIGEQLPLADVPAQHGI